MNPRNPRENLLFPADIADKIIRILLLCFILFCVYPRNPREISFVFPQASQIFADNIFKILLFCFILFSVYPRNQRELSFLFPADIADFSF